jgi:DNA polymerase I-like protein with 3'-5' exonuclease and polymerase domains
MKLNSLLFVLEDMEFEGIKVDKKTLKLSVKIFR